ncbi:MAG: TRAP transporter fused permease subunit [Solobacterium sp.]|nr:TRAP transporter fused permease subunit [Solobacterium sp.]MBR3202738.1 TRAP transporter fused permease subunit [Solobacterium sp.]
MSESNNKTNVIQQIINVIALALGIYHFFAAKFTLVNSNIHIIIHFLGSFLILFLSTINTKANDSKGKAKNIFCLICIALILVDSVYIAANHDKFITAMGNYSDGQIYSGAIYLALFLIGTYIAWGKVIPIIVMAALLYGYFGPSMPGFLYHGGLSVERLITYSTTNFTGVFGLLGTISANQIILFSIFAGMMTAYGALDCIMRVAMSASGKIRSGAAQVAVISSGLIGSVTGSVAANISMTGSVSIPLMKKRGYPDEFAAACESAASTGGAILPPVMNAASFIIASWTNTPYIKIIIYGLTPALLYYLGIGLSVYIKAIKLGDEKMNSADIPKFRDAALEFFTYIIPIIVLVILLSRNYSAEFSLFFSIIAMILVGLAKEIRRTENIADNIKTFFAKLLSGFREGARTCSSIAIVMGIMGVVVQILTATGLPSKIAQFAINSAGNSLFMLGLFVAISCLVFGMGMPAAPAYVLCALLGAPALTAFGVPLLAAHFFVFYYGEMSAITPPVAIGCLVASGMAKSNFMKTCVEAMRLAIAGFILPFMFLYRPEIMFGLKTVGSWAWAVIMVIIFLLTFIMTWENFFLDKLTVIERGISAVACICCLMPIYVLDFAGIALFALLMIMHVRRYRMSQKTAAGGV